MNFVIHGRAVGKTHSLRMQMSLLAGGKFRLRKSRSLWILTRSTMFAIFPSFGEAWHFLFPNNPCATVRNEDIMRR